MRFIEVDTPGKEELVQGQIEGVVSMNGNHYVALVKVDEESPYGFQLISKYHSTPYRYRTDAVEAAKDLSYVYKDR